MKRLLPYLLAATLLVSGVSTVWAVEKKQKETPPVKPTEVPKKPASVKPVDSKGAPKTTDKQAKPVKKYDNFVDRNNNGIDDRRENLKKK